MYIERDIQKYIIFRLFQSFIDNILNLHKIEAMNYKETCAFLFSQLPMYQRQGKSAYKADLDNIVAFSARLNHPENRFKSIHIAGTNGKGSVSHMLAAVMQTAGYKTGLYTSPHLKDFRERIKIDGEMISEKEVVEFVENNKASIDAIKPSFFEMTVAMAFDYFAKNAVDIAVIEVGLGGRLDSTNIISPVLSVITNISYDHTQLLGNTIEAIANEKAGIIKRGIPVVIGESEPESESVFKAVSYEKCAPIFFADQIYSAEDSEKKEESLQVLTIKKGGQILYKDLKLDLAGNYQKKNVLTVIQAFDLLKSDYKLDEGVLRKALMHVTTITKFEGRWQILGKRPMIIADTGHNKAGLEEVIRQIKTYPYKNLRIVFGTVNDKDIDEILKLLPTDGIYYFTKADIPRALDEKILKEKAATYGLKGNSYTHTGEAMQAVRSESEANDLIYIGGSTFIVAECI